MKQVFFIATVICGNKQGAEMLNVSTKVFTDEQHAASWAVKRDNFNRTQLDFCLPFQINITPAVIMGWHEEA